MEPGNPMRNLGGPVDKRWYWWRRMERSMEEKPRHEEKPPSE
jgi:hypothetical protein